MKASPQTYWRIACGSWKLMESSAPKEIRRMGESRFTCSRRKESLLRRSSRKWCCGRPGTKKQVINHWSEKCKRTRHNFWLKCDDAGLKASVQRLTEPRSAP